MATTSPVVRRRRLGVVIRRLLWDEIRKLVARGKTVLLTTHYLQEADALANRIVVINRGEIVAQGSPADIKAQTADVLALIDSMLEHHGTDKTRLLQARSP